MKTEKKSSQSIRFKRYLELIDEKKGMLLDLGCGVGEFASCLSNGYDYHGIEILPNKVRDAWEKGLSVIRFDLNKGIPYPNKTFDIVLAGEIIEHMPNPSGFLSEVNRVLKDDGIFVGSTPNSTNPTHYFMDEIINPVLFKKGMTGGMLGHYYFFNRAQLEALFELNGLMITKVTGTTLMPSFAFMRRLSGWLGKIAPRFSVSLVFKAEKAVAR